jgi:hypothetical protein
MSAEPRESSGPPSDLIYSGEQETVAGEPV